MRALRLVKNFTRGKVIVLFFVLCLCTPNLDNDTLSETIDKVVAIVNNDIITLSELDDAANLFFNDALGIGNFNTGETNRAEMMKKTLNKLIDDKLIEQEIKKLGIVASDKEINNAIQNILKKNSISKQDMIERLKSEGLRFDEYKKQMKREMEKARFIEYEIREKITLNDDDIKKYYKENIDFFKVVREVKVQHILLSIPSNTSEVLMQEIYRKAGELMERLQKGEDFGELAKIYSQGASAKSGGDMGWFNKGELIPFLERVVFKLKVGEVSHVIRSPLGLHLIKLVDKREGGVTPLEEVKDKIREIVMERAVEKEFKEMLEELRDRSFFKIKL